MNSWVRPAIPSALIVLFVFLAYEPAWFGKPIWDDDRHMIPPGFQSVTGLAHIWMQPGATQQYYPLAYTAFWMEHKLWGDSTLGYHLVNILMHAASALLVLGILQKLQVPGAWLAAGIFALHPVQVESVAWISELKNTLSGFFYLASALAYLTFDQTRSRKFFAAALGLFMLGLLSKTVIATLPAALLLIFWWKRGRLFWKRDVLPLVPFFLAGIGTGLFTAWFERKVIHAEGQAFDFSFIERILIAGRALWFYMGQLCWPAKLVFGYPRWDVSRGLWWQYLFPAAMLLLLAALWCVRRRWRGPLAGLLFFTGTLFPALGFFNVYPFRYSFVADHFQYLASLGIITLASAGAALLLSRWRLWGRAGGNLPCLMLLAALAGLTWRQAGMYTDLETLWRTTLAKNPDCWLARNNLGTLLADKGQVDEAIQNFRKAIQINPDYPEAWYNLGNTLAAQGRFDEAIQDYRKAIQINPNSSDALSNLGLALTAQGRFDEALESQRKAIQINPNSSSALNNLALALADKGRFDEAIENYRKAIQINPNYCEALDNLGIVLVTQGRFDEAIESYRKAIQINPNYCEALDNLGIALATQGRFDEAIGNYRQAIQVNPNRPETFLHLGMTLGQLGRTREAAAQYREALRLNPNLAGALNNLAWVLAASSDDGLRNGAEAVRLAERACELTHYGEPLFIGTLAAAYAEAGRFPEAVTTAEKAEQLATAAGLPAVAAKNRQLLELYRAGKPCHEPAPAGP